MNDRMWEHPATQANVALLRERGVEVLEPGDRPPRDARRVGRGAPARAGRAAGRGRGAPARRATLARACASLVTAGGTREPIDAVRFVGNRSSGRMGFALADAAAARGAEVVVVAANVALARDARRALRRRRHAPPSWRDACEREFAAAPTCS